MRDVEMTEEEKKFIEERGFEQASACPGDVGWFPYVALCRGNADEFDVVFYMRVNQWAGQDMEAGAPDDLADRVEAFVGKYGKLEGHIYEAAKGEPIKVYIANKDTRWQPVVDELVSRRKYQV